MTKWYMEEDVLFLLKTLKKEYLESTLDGKLCFCCPETFTSTTNGLLSGQQDTWDSYLSHKISHLVAAPIISGENEPIQYGTGIKLANKAYIHECNNIIQHSPFICFRKVQFSDIEHSKEYDVFKLGSLVDKIKSEMGHDAYILIHCPSKFLLQLNKIEHFFAHSIHYGEIDEAFEEFLETYPKQQSKMFQKSMEYAWQKEYRLVLSPRKDTNKVFIQMGSIREIAFGGDLETLRGGILFQKEE